MSSKKNTGPKSLPTNGWLKVIVYLTIFFGMSGMLVFMQAPNPQTTQQLTPQDDEYWKDKLTPEQYAIMREEDTERAFSSPLNHVSEPGTFVTADTGVPVFRTDHKYDSGSGWPSFWQPSNPDAIELVEDTSWGMKRVEVRSKDTGAHLGHVFDDGPQPTGQRFCINGSALKFIPDKKE